MTRTSKVSSPAGRRLRAAAAALVALAAPLAVAEGAGAASAMAPALTVHARYLPSDHNLLFSGVALAKGGRMLAVLQFRLEQFEGGRWQPVTAWMALITGVGARWQSDGRYQSQLMAMNEPVPAGRLRVEMHVADSTGLGAIAYSNPVQVR